MDRRNELAQELTHAISKAVFEDSVVNECLGRARASGLKDLRLQANILFVQRIALPAQDYVDDRTFMRNLGIKTDEQT